MAAAIDPRVDALHDGREVEFVVIMFVRSSTERVPNQGLTSLSFHPIVCT